MTEKKLKKNNPTIALNVLNIKHKFKTQLISSKPNHFLNDSKRRNMTLSFSKEVPILLREMKPRHIRDFYCFKCLHSFRTKTKFDFHKKVCQNKDYYGVGLMPSKDNKIFEFNPYQESDKTQSIIYANLELLIKKIGEYKNNFEKSSIAREY